MNVLLVEDDLNIQELFKSVIEELKEPVKLFTSESSNKALQIATENLIDIFILDIQLSDYKGTQLAKQLRDMEIYAYTPMIFATALAGEELQAYRELKSFHFLIKPFTKVEIQQVLIDVITYKKRMKERTKKFRMEQKGFILELDLEKILYFESFGKKIEIHVITVDMEEKTEVISGYSLKQLREMTENDSFIQCHKSFIVNQKYIHKIDKANSIIQLTVWNREIPVGKKFMENL